MPALIIRCPQCPPIQQGTSVRLHATRLLLVAGALLGASLAGFPLLLNGQEEKAPAPKTDGPSPMAAIGHDLVVRKKALLSEKSDLDAMGNSLTGPEGSVVLALDEKAGQGVMELDATIYFVIVYDNMQCDRDREIAKNALTNRLGFYSHMLGLAADQTAGQLAYTKSPAVAQAGQRLKDELRAARDKLDEINASLR